MAQKEKTNLDNIDLSRLSDKEKRDLILSMRRLGGKKGSTKRAAPTTDDELHAWILDELGYDIPRVAVCEDHQAPFDYVADYYFERENAILVIGGRESAKTLNTAIANFVFAETKSGCEVCVTGDTLIDCPRDHRLYPNGIPINIIKPGQLIWTFSEDNFIFELKRIKQVKLTHKNCQVYKLKLDDGSVIRATAEHKFLRRNGEWVKLCDLKTGDSLMPMYRDFEPYVRIRPDATGGGEKISEYKAVANYKWEDRKGFHVDHIDEVHANSGEDNLQLLTVSEHASKTMKGRNVGFRRKKQQKSHTNSVNDLKRSKLEKEILEKLKDIPEDKLTVPQLEALDRYYTYFQSYERSRRRELEKAKYYNHKIDNIEIDGIEDVWDLEVEDNHNFVSCGVVLHNCTFADIEQQSNKSYSYIKSFLYTTNDSGEKILKSSVESTLRKETLLKNLSKLEIIIGTLSGVNSPHPQKVHADEVDLLDKEIWQESQPVDIYIPTPNGQIRFGDLEVGDCVFGSDGKETKIVGIKDFDEKDIYRFDFTDGRSTEACIDHLWKVIMRRKKWGVFKTKELLSKYKVKDPRCNGYNYKYKIPQQLCVEYEKKDLDIHPYILGVLLGDGTFRQSTISFRANDIDIADRVEELLPDKIYMSDENYEGYAKFNIVYRGSGIPNPFRKKIEELELYKTDSFTKFIPLEYLESDYEDRIELLRGLMDTDGSFTKDPYFASVSHDLCSGVKELVQSLGGRAIMRKKKTSRTGYSGGCGYIYEVSASLPNDINPFYCFRKAQKFKSRIRTLDPSIRNIEFTGKKKARCITVDNDDGLYLTEEFIVTHNSRNMSSSKTFSDGRTIKAQDIATSTLKSTKGIVQGIVDETQKAKKEGLKPTWKIYKACFAPETLVRAENGYCEIKDVVPGMKVLSKNGIYRNVIFVNKKSFNGNIVNLRNSCGLNFRCTEDHKICGLIDSYTLASAYKPKGRKKYGFKEDFIEAEYLERGNYLRSEFLSESETIDREYIDAPINTLKISKGIYGDGYCLCGCGGNPKIATHTRGRGTRGKPNDYLPGHHFKRKFHESYKLDDDFLWAIGMFCAEGTCSQGTIQYSLHEDEVSYINRLKRFFERYGFNTNLCIKNNKGVQLQIYSTQLSEWWQEWIGKGCENKKIPYELLNLPLEKVLKVAEGVLDGDGCYRWDALGQTSPILALQMSEISHRNNGRATIAISKKRNRKQCYTLNNFFMELPSGRKTAIYFEHKNHRGFWNYNNYKYSKIVEAKKEFYEGDVYDLTIEDEPYFVVGNTLVHNCVFEVGKEVPFCRKAPKDLREKRLLEMGKDPCELCECDKVAKGEIVEGVPRTLESICKGKFFKSRGWMAHDDVIRKFVQNTPNKWASQLECRRPMADGLYLPTFSRERHCIRGYEPRPEYGYIWMGVDWGGSANSTSAVLWFQGPLHQPIQIDNTIGTKTVIPQGAFVIFKEINESAIGATRLADKVARQEIQYRNRYGNAWRVKSRFADKAGAQQRMDWREHNPPLRTQWYLSGKYLDPTVECLQSLVIDNLLYVDDQQCPGTCDDFESWRSKDGSEVHDDASHNPAAARYGLKNVSVIMKRYGKTSNRETLAPIVAGRENQNNLPGAIQIGVSSSGENLAASERWRDSLGGPANPADLGRNREKQPWQI